MHLLSSETLLKIAIDLVLGVGTKLFCDHGRIHWRDLVYGYRFWRPAEVPATEVFDEPDYGHAAK